MQETLSSPVLDTPPVAPPGSEFDFSSQSLTPDMTAMSGSPDSPFAADPGMPTGAVNTVDSAPPEPTTPDTPPTTNPGDGERSRSRRRPTPDADPTAPDSGSTPPTPPEPPTNSPFAGEAGRPKRAPRLRRLGASALIGAGAYAALRNGLFDSVHDRLDSTIGENASEVADIAVVSSVLAATSLRLFTAKLRMSATKLELAVVKARASSHINVFEDIRKAKQVIFGDEITPTLDPKPGTIISSLRRRAEDRADKRMIRARDKGTQILSENIGVRRHMARRKQGSTVHTLYTKNRAGWPGFSVTINTSEQGIGDDQHWDDFETEPHTKKERKRFLNTILEQNHLEHEAHELEEEAEEDTVGKVGKKLEKSNDRQDVLKLRLKGRKKAVKAIEKRKDARSQTYDRAKTQVSRGVRAASSTIRNDIRSYRARTRR